MTGAFRVMVAAIHADPNLADPAIYRRAGAPDVAVRVVLTRPQEPTLGVAGATLGGLEATLPVAALPFVPKRGDLLIIEGVERQVERRERDEIAAQWRLILSKAPAP